ncbi:hypothetical protein [Croceivirga thetidis]|uniref:Uncharacterized protein n=1 Tax=Croceivirga thetidis TaxID=2721623 RepID=A0ABX1GQA0_9FLAO|nr:hypothetical protein [Croceivirga thetidis]NKI30972.1 hypothetical protein [Croceivirga thetidis]
MTHKQRLEKSMEKKAEYYVTKIVKGIAIGVLIIGLFFLANYVLMRLWNWLMPDLFGLSTIDYWQALGILVLAKIIFGFGGGDSSKSSSKKDRKSNFKKKEKCSSFRRDFSEWKLYDEFWESEGEKAFQAYVEKRNEDNGEKEES